MTNIFVIGDSHSNYFYYSDKINHHWFGWAGLPVTMFQFIKEEIPLYNIVSRYNPGQICEINIKDNDFVVFSFGWNDIQKNIYKYNNKNYEIFIENMVDNYIKKILILSKKEYKINPIINCIYPVKIDGENKKEKIIYTLCMNNQLKIQCKKNNIPFFDIYDKIQENKEYKLPDGDHLNHENKELKDFIENKLLYICNN